VNHLLSKGKGFSTRSDALTARSGRFNSEKERKMKVMVRLIVAVVLLSLVASPVLGLADLPAALGYLKTQQNADGGFGNGFTPDSALGSTADALFAIVALGGDVASFSRDGSTPLTYLAGNVSSATSAGDLSKLILALVPAGEDPRTFGAADLVARLEGLVGADGKIGGADDTFVSTLMAALALKSAKRPVPPASLDLIGRTQQANGGWAWDGTAGTAADTNTTAYAVMALVAGGEAASSSAVTKALAYLGGIQNDDGGWPYQNPSDYGTATDANSTAVTVQAILAAGQDPAGAEWTTAEGKTPYDALDTLQNASGAWAWKADTPADNLLATVQAAPARAGKTLPLPENVGARLRPVWLAAALVLVLTAVGATLLVRRGRAR
jgi:hypothetical protein